tara:strand:- start:20181 stop:22559 length:2379 start_codon:yes stop_codon:yes gene_type:complete
MTTREDKYQNRLAIIGAGQETLGVANDPNIDPTGQYPSQEYHNISTVNRAAYGASTNNLEMGSNLFGVNGGSASHYGKNRIIASECGHTIEMDDTPGNQRILIKHKTGNGIEFKTDGSMVMVAGNQTISVTKDQQIVIEGNATIIYGGNVDMQVGGDFNLSVGGSYNVSVGENLKTNVEGSMRTTVDDNVGLTIKGNKSETILKTTTTTVLGDNNIITKGAARYTSQGNMQLSSGANTQISARDKFFQSGFNMNIAATDLSVFGVSGTIGGENIINYGKSATYSAGVTAPTFTGDLTGRADTAIAADTAQLSAGATLAGAMWVSPVTANNWENTDQATVTSALPTASLLNDYLFNTSIGAVEVKVDIGDHLFKSINKANATGGLASKDLTTAEYRAYLRNSYNASNNNFVGSAVASGKLSEKYTKTTPDNIGRISSKGPTEMRGENRIGVGFISDADSKFKPPQDNIKATFTPAIIISDVDDITNGTKLSDGVTIASFAGCIGQKGNINQFTKSEKTQIARNLQPHAELLKRFRENKDKEFKGLRLVAVEGIYNPTTVDLAASGWKDSINYYRSKGRAIVYELQDANGQLVTSKMFDLAVKLKNTSSFEKLILDHDEFDPSGNLNTQIVIITPSFNDSYTITDGKFVKDVTTMYNGKVQSTSDLVEIAPEPAPPPVKPAPVGKTNDPFISKVPADKGKVYTFSTWDKIIETMLNGITPFKPTRDASKQNIYARANDQGGKIYICIGDPDTAEGDGLFRWRSYNAFTIKNYESTYDRTAPTALKEVDNTIRLE